MAILKHISSKNADYGAAEAYLTFQHDEFSMKPTRDENGRLMPREDYRISSLNCGGEDFAVACMRSNLRYGKNQKREDVKSHHYIISFDPRDGTDNGLTVDRAQQLGEQFCADHFPGHQALICTHPDGHNHTENIHVHIVINSLRIADVPMLPHMDRPADRKAGMKHRCTDATVEYFKAEVMEMCHREGLYQIDLLHGSKERITDREYWAQKKGQLALDTEAAAQGKPPTKFETDKEKLRREIAAYLSRNRGMEVDPECILVGAGTEYLYGRLLRLLQKDRYAVEDPGYRKIARIYRDSGAECCYIPVDESGICTEKLRESGAEVVHVSPGYHFPLGTVMPIARRQELLAWASEAPGRYIVEDDYDCEFRYSGRPIPSIQSMDRQQRVIYLNTFNKTLSPALRVGYMVLPEPLMACYEQSMNYYSNTVSSFEQFALAEFMEKGYFERHISRMRKYYREYRERIRLILKESVLPISKTGGDEAGTRILVELVTTLTDAQIKQEAAKVGIKLECLSEFCQERKEMFAHTLILNYADMDEAVMKEAIGRLAHIFSK